MDEINQPFVFQSDSSIINRAYENCDNYLIDYNNCQDKSYCALYFSSNNIYYPNTENSFKLSIINKDRYEWFGTRVPYAHKHIFLRDIIKQWYLTGLNGNINSPEKLLSFLISETKGYKIITLGSSAGGFAAVLYGSLLKAQLILSFNGQFEIQSLLKTSTELINPILFRLKRDNHLLDYFDVKPFIHDGSNIFYFYSNGNTSDYEQKKHIEATGLNVIGFRTKHHGVPFLKCNLPVVLEKSPKELKSLSDRKHNPLWFSIRLVGFKATITGLFTQLLKRYNYSYFNK